MIIVQLDSEQLSNLIQNSIRTVLSESQLKSFEGKSQDQLLTIQEAAKFLTLSVPTLYGKVSKKEIPFMKRSKRLYFSVSELTYYLKHGKNMGNSEIEAERDNFLTNKRKGLKP